MVEPEERYDVAILGGGLAGLTLALQLKRTRLETSILIAEKRAGPAPEAAFKVGESTVEVSAHYFSEVVGMKDHLESRQLPKAGLRFFFPAGDNTDITRRVEWGATAVPPVPSYQLDRGRFENALAERCTDSGCHLLDGCEVTDAELGDEHRVTVVRDDRTETITARWVVDATGPRRLLRGKLGLEKDIDHTINSAWFRLGGGIDIDEWGAGNEAWLDRMDERGVRRLSTNHLMGQGYWVWLIPLASGPISIGIVADPRFHAFDEINDLDRAVDWLGRHEPQLAAEIADRREQVEDFHSIEDFAYSCQRVFSPERWALTGVAGVFADPFYSPGSDFIAQGNTMITDLIVRDLAGEDIQEEAEALNGFFLIAFESLVGNTYTNHYPEFGNAEVFSAKLLWNFALYWTVFALPFFQGKLTDQEFNVAVFPDVIRVLTVAMRLEQVFRDWHALGEREWSDVFISNRAFALLYGLHTDLHEDFDDTALKAKYSENADLLEAVAVVLFHKALAALPEQSIDADTKVDPAKLVLDPQRWEEEGLLGGPGLTLNEARAKTAGIQDALLDEVASPA